MENKRKTVNVLLVENDSGDQLLVRNALKNSEYKVELQIVPSGEHAIAYLDNTLQFPEKFPRPGLILCDLNMLGMGGKGFLKYVKANDDFKSIPVVVVTSSDLPEDVEECYKLHAAGFITKASSFAEFDRIVQKLTKYWFPVSAVL